MSLHPVRAICTNCSRSLPRAAAYRCPFCRARIVRRTAAGRRGKAPHPQAPVHKAPREAETFERREI